GGRRRRRPRAPRDGPRPAAPAAGRGPPGPSVGRRSCRSLPQACDPTDAMSWDRSMAKAWAWGALVVLALSYCAPYSYLRSVPGRLVGAWGASVPEAHRITLCVGAACILTLLAVRAGRTPGIGMRVPMYAAAVIGLGLALVTSFSYPGNATYKAGPGVRLQ